MLNKQHLKLMSHLLKMASEQFGNHGCGDFNLEAVIPDVEDRRALLKAMHESNGDPEEFDPKRDYQYAMDWWLMSYFAKHLKDIVAQALEEGFELAEAFSDIDYDWDGQSPYTVFSKSREQLKKRLDEIKNS